MDQYHKFGFGNYIYDSNGNIVFDTNNNGIYDDNWGSNGVDDDNDWGPFKDEFGNTYIEPHEEFVDLNGNNIFDSDVGEGYLDFNGILQLLDFGLDGIPATDANQDGDYDDEGDIAPDYGEGNGVWDGETYVDLNGNSEWDVFQNNDLDGDGEPSVGENGVDEFDERDFSMNYGSLSSVYKDANDDGVDDYPEFNVRNCLLYTSPSPRDVP